MTSARGVVLDAGAFIAAERRAGTMVALMNRLVRERVPLLTSAGVVAQVWRGGGHRQVPIAYLLRHTVVRDLTAPVARVLGQMLGITGSADPIDAHVVFLARENNWPVLTSDPNDLLALDPTLHVEVV